MASGSGYSDIVQLLLSAKASTNLQVEVRSHFNRCNSTRIFHVLVHRMVLQHCILHVMEGMQRWSNVY